MEGRKTMKIKTNIEPGVNLVLRAAYRLDAEGYAWNLLGNCVGKFICVFLPSFRIWENEKVDEKKTEAFVVKFLGDVVSHELLHRAIMEEGIRKPMYEEEAVVSSVCPITS